MENVFGVKYDGMHTSELMKLSVTAYWYFKAGGPGVTRLT